MIDYSKYKWLDVKVTLPESAKDKEKDAKRLLDTLDKKDYPEGKKNLFALYYFDQCDKYAKEDRLNQLELDSNLSKTFRSWSKSQSLKKLYDQLIQNEKGKYVMSGIVIIMTCTLVLFFLRAILSEDFVVNFSVDAIVGAIALLFLYRNMRIKYRMLKKYTNIKDFMYLDVASIVLCVLLKIWLPATFDVSLVILMITYYISKKRFDKVLQEFKI